MPQQFHLESFYFIIALLWHVHLPLQPRQTAYLSQLFLKLSLRDLSAFSVECPMVLISKHVRASVMPFKASILDLLIPLAKEFSQDSVSVEFSCTCIKGRGASSPLPIPCSSTSVFGFCISIFSSICLLLVSLAATEISGKQNLRLTRDKSIHRLGQI